MKKKAYIQSPTIPVWECKQLVGDTWLRPEDIRVGMPIGVCEHARRTFSNGNIPKQTRFIQGRVTKIFGDPDDLIMTVEYSRPDVVGVLGITFGVKQYACLCIGKRKS